MYITDINLQNYLFNLISSDKNDKIYYFLHDFDQFKLFKNFF